MPLITINCYCHERTKVVLLKSSKNTTKKWEREEMEKKECLFCGNENLEEIEEVYDPDEIDDGTLYICQEKKGCSK